MFLTSICVIRLFEMYCANISHSSDNLRLLITLSKFIKGTNCFNDLSFYDFTFYLCLFQNLICVIVMLLRMKQTLRRSTHFYMNTFLRD